MIYKALALQTTCHAIHKCPYRTDVTALILQSIERLKHQIAASINFIGRDVKLVVLPEYFLTGFPMGETIATWRDKVALEMDGVEYDTLCNIAAQQGIYLSGNAYERDPHFPNLYFQTSFIINPKGVIALRYRRLHSMFTPTPHDVWDKYLDIYGLEGVFPVLKTADVGNLACIASEEILYPELARCMAVRGAEIFLHSSSEIGSPLLTQKNVAKLARAIENMAYIVSANSAGIIGTPIPAASTDAGSKIVDYRGIVQCEAGYGESMIAFSDINLYGLRHFRQQPAMGNLLARQRFELYADTYSKMEIYPPNTCAEQIPDRQHFIQTQKKVIEKLKTQNII
jgi:predicted amidohydrolase